MAMHWQELRMPDSYLMGMEYLVVALSADSPAVGC